MRERRDRGRILLQYGAVQSWIGLIEGCAAIDPTSNVLLTNTGLPMGTLGSLAAQGSIGSFKWGILDDESRTLFA